MITLILMTAIVATYLALRIEGAESKLVAANNRERAPERRR